MSTNRSACGKRGIGDRIRGAAAAALLLSGLVLDPAPPAAEAAGQPDRATASGRALTGVISGAQFDVELPEGWNGVLVLYTHGYFPPGHPVPDRIMHAHRPQTEEWLLAHGYALAASDFRDRYGAAYKQGPRDQLALLDWFSVHVGRPRQVVALGSSMGAALSVLLAERHPDRIDGVAALCAPFDMNATWNVSLDVTFAIRTLLSRTPIDLVRPRRAPGSVDALRTAVREAVRTPRGRARLALANALGNVDGWNSADRPRPTRVVDQVNAMAAIDQMLFVNTFGPTGRADLERRAGGNPSWNTGVDYARQLARSSQRTLVDRAYREGGLGPRDLRADLARLAAAPRIGPDPGAVRWMYRYGVPTGATPAPVVTLHTISDPTATDQERWYATQVRRSGRPAELRQLYIGRATHCAFTAAEEITTLQVLFDRLETGHWPDTSPSRTNTRAAAFDRRFQHLPDYVMASETPGRPAFTTFTPPEPLRPSR